MCRCGMDFEFGKIGENIPGGPLKLFTRRYIKMCISGHIEETAQSETLTSLMESYAGRSGHTILVEPIHVIPPSSSGRLQEMSDKMI